MRRRKILIIGAGLSGLTFGALAARDGHEVVLYDRNHEPGGVVALTHEGDFSFEQGPLILSDLLPSESICNFLQELGICLETVRDDRGLSTRDFDLIRPKEYAGPNWRKEKLKELFPEEARGIDAYYRFYDALMEIRYQSSRRDSPMKRIRMGLAFLKVRKYQDMTCEEFTDLLFHGNAKLKLVFNGILADFCADPAEVQCFTLPFVNTETAFDKRIPLDHKGREHYYGGFAYLKDGCQKLPEALLGSIAAHDGTFVPDTIVENVLVEGGRARGIRLADGTEADGDIVVGCGSARDFFEKMVGLEHLDEGYRRILRECRPMEAVFMVHLGVDYDPRRYQEQSLVYYYRGYDLHGAIDRLRNGVYHEGADGYLISFPDAHAPGFAPEGYHCVTIYTVCPDTLREGDWETMKERYADQLIALAEEHLPGLSKHIVAKKIMTALDYRKMTHTSKSSFGGLVPIRGQKNPPHVTPVRDLYFVGQQSENGGGVPTVINGAREAYRKFQSMHRSSQ